jgi:hypothetical protein
MAGMVRSGKSAGKCHENPMKIWLHPHQFMPLHQLPLIHAIHVMFLDVLEIW